MNTLQPIPCAADLEGSFIPVGLNSGHILQKPGKILKITIPRHQSQRFGFNRSWGSGLILKLPRYFNILPRLRFTTWVIIWKSQTRHYCKYVFIPHRHALTCWWDSCHSLNANTVATTGTSTFTTRKLHLYHPPPEVQASPLSPPTCLTLRWELTGSWTISLELQLEIVGPGALKSLLSINLVVWPWESYSTVPCFSYY